MFNLDKYLYERFNLTSYNCWHFVRDVWFELTGYLLYDYTPAGKNKYELELAANDATRYFVEVQPQAWDRNLPLIVLFRQPRNTPHIGVLFKGKVLHLRPTGARYESLDVASIGFSKVSFYTCRPSTSTTTPST